MCFNTDLTDFLFSCILQKLFSVGKKSDQLYNGAMGSLGIYNGYDLMLGNLQVISALLPELLHELYVAEY